MTKVVTVYDRRVPMTARGVQDQLTASGRTQSVTTSRLVSRNRHRLPTQPTQSISERVTQAESVCEWVSPRNASNINVCAGDEYLESDHGYGS